MARPDIKRIGQALGFLQTGIVDPVEEILQRAAHIAQVLRGAENDALRCQHILRTGLQRRLYGDGDAFDPVRTGAPRHRIAQRLRIIRRGVRNDE